MLMLALLIAEQADTKAAVKAASATWVDCVLLEAKPKMVGSDDPQRIAKAAMATCESDLITFEREALNAYRSAGYDNADALARTALLIEESRESLQSSVVTMVRAYRRYASKLRD